MRAPGTDERKLQLIKKRVNHSAEYLLIIFAQSAMIKMSLFFVATPLLVLRPLCAECGLFPASDLAVSAFDSHHLSRRNSLDLTFPNSTLQQIACRCPTESSIRIYKWSVYPLNSSLLSAVCMYTGNLTVLSVFRATTGILLYVESQGVQRIL